MQDEQQPWGQKTVTDLEDISENELKGSEAGEEKGGIRFGGGNFRNRKEMRKEAGG